MSPDTTAPHTERTAISHAPDAPSVASLVLGSAPPPGQPDAAAAPIAPPAAAVVTPAVVTPAVTTPAVEPQAPVTRAPEPTPPSGNDAELPQTQPIATAQAPTAAYLQRDDFQALSAKDVEEGVTRLRGPAARVVQNMEASLEVPTATSVRTVPAKLIMDNRVVINNHLARTRGGKVSFTHLIGFAIVEALAEFPAMNVAYALEDGKPAMFTPEHVNFGLAIDLAKDDGTRQLLVPNIKAADQMDFAQFWHAYDDLIRKARSGALQAELVIN